MFSSVSRVSVGPFDLFVVGNSDLLDSSISNRRFAVAGSRRVSPGGASWLRSQVSRLTHDHVLVSGLALGSDSVAHHSALAYGVPQIAVLPCGFDRITPRSNIELARDIVASGGCLVSLLPPSARASRFSYIARNEVIAFLGSMLIVPEFAVRSGTRHTVDFARNFGRYIIVRDSPASGNQFILNSNSYKTISQ